MKFYKNSMQPLKGVVIKNTKENSEEEKNYWKSFQKEFGKSNVTLL